MRATMAEMTARRDRRFDVSRIEATLGGQSYSVKTLAHLAKAIPEADFYFIVGADVLPELKDWFKPERISRWATLACGVRPGYPRPSPESLPVDRVAYFEGPELDISSSDIRRRVAAREPYEEFLSPDVARFVLENGLYSSAR
jgi:nicotinate-nucleotide adenylyltransferase